MALFVSRDGYAAFARASSAASRSPTRPLSGQAEQPGDDEGCARTGVPIWPKCCSRRPARPKHPRAHSTRACQRGSRVSGLTMGSDGLLAVTKPCGLVVALRLAFRLALSLPLGLMLGMGAAPA